MAKTFKVSYYFVDETGGIGVQNVENIINNSYFDWLYSHYHIHQLHVEESEPYEWNDNLPENQDNADLADIECRFKHDNTFAHVKVGGTYQHFKGHLVKVIAVSRGTEYGEWNVVYEHLGDHRIWHRPLSMFCSKVDKEKYPNVKQEYRFTLVDDMELNIVPDGDKIMSITNEDGNYKFNFNVALNDIRYRVTLSQLKEDNSNE